MYQDLRTILLLIILCFSSFNLIAFSNGYNSKSDDCNPPSNIRINENSLDSVKIIWKSSINGIAWKLEWRKRDSIYTVQNSSPLINTKEFVIKNLDSNSQYYFRIKTICNDDSESNWSNEHSFITHLSNPSYCNLDFKLNDYNHFISQAGKTIFYIQNDEYKDKLLGIDVFLQNIKLIVQHSWTSDLEIVLRSPSGKSIVLTSSYGLNDGIGYGNPNDTTCMETVVFSDEACNSIRDNMFPFVGTFQPKEELNNLYDQTTPSGIWELEIIDDKKGNSGYLKYVELDFEPIICPVPKNISLIPVNDISTNIKWDLNNNVDSVNLIISSDLENFDLIVLNTGEYLLNNLNSSQNYKIELQSKCENVISTTSCLDSVQLLCGLPDTRIDFEDLEVCENGCDEYCFDIGIWFNASNGQRNWLVNHGETSTENTGPKEDVYGLGKYAYIESSPGNCNIDSLAILQSDCIKVNPAFNGCNMSFYYHMYGIDIGTLNLEISTDNGQSWTQLFSVTGEQGSQWIKQDIDLIDYEDKTCSFRFIANTHNKGSYGDIAIDDVILYNSIVLQPGENLYYPDRDQDGFGKDTIGTFFCNLTDSIFVSNNFDCNDNNSLINPNAEEILCNFIDENCNGMEDDSKIVNPIEANIVSIINESCNGSSDGSIIINVEKGYPPYNFNWSNSSTDSILTDLPAGEYWCELTDLSGCGIRTDTFIVQHENPIDFVLLDKILPTCKGAGDGEILIDHLGGTPPFKYFWSSGDTIKNITSLEAGIYQVTITDSLGCKLISPEIELKAITLFDVVVLDKVEPTCFGGINGNIKLRVNGGNEPFSYEWSSGQNTKEIENIGAGEYFCTITDSDLCYHVFGPIIIDQPDSLVVFISSLDHVTCIGEDNGFIEIGTKGGTQAYTFEWFNNNEIISRNDDIYNLKSGMYNVKVRDLNGCEKILTDIEIKTLDSIHVELDSIRNVNCEGTNDGYIKVLASKGYGDYYYYWNTTETSTNFIEDLNTGLYGVTVTDDLGCKQILNNLEIKNLNIPLEINLNILDSIYCFNDFSGAITAKTFSDNKPYDFNWSAGAKVIKKSNIDTLKFISAGEYNVTVTDSKGCVGFSEFITITQPDKLDVTDIEIDELLCYGDKTGRISLAITGGNNPYEVIWNDTTNGYEITKLAMGSYQATIIDNNDCELVTDMIKLTQPDKLKVTIESNPAHIGKSNGSARILPEGGVSPYEILWDENANNQIGNEAFDLASGWYDVTLTDYNECFKDVKVFIGEIVATNDLTSDGINVFPNPVDDMIYFSFNNDFNEISIDILNIMNQDINLQFELEKHNNIKLPTAKLPNGQYIIHLAVDGKHYFHKIAVIH